MGCARRSRALCGCVGSTLGASCRRCRRSTSGACYCCIERTGNGPAAPPLLPHGLATPSVRHVSPQCRRSSAGQQPLNPSPMLVYLHAVRGPQSGTAKRLAAGASDQGCSLPVTMHRVQMPPHPHAHLLARQPELGEADKVGEQDAGNGSHGPAAVGQLSLAEPLQLGGVGAQAQGVEAIVAHCAQAGGSITSVLLRRASKQQEAGKAPSSCRAATLPLHRRAPEIACGCARKALKLASECASCCLEWGFCKSSLESLQQRQALNGP